VALVRPTGSDLIARARAGDGEAFAELTAPHRRELQVHCYRTLGSFQGAEDALRSARRRAAKEWDVPNVEPPEPTRLGEVVWLQPYPDDLLEDPADAPPGPEARYEQTEAISLAFVTALQALPPRQVAVLILRDVLGFHASEVAGMLEVTVESVTSALKRVRASLQRRLPPADARRPPPAARRPPPAPPPAPPPRRRSWRSSSARGSPLIWTRLWPC